MQSCSIIRTLICLTSLHLAEAFGMCEETVPIYAIMIPIFVVAGYDALVGIFLCYIRHNDWGVVKQGWWFGEMTAFSLIFLCIQVAIV